MINQIAINGYDSNFSYLVTDGGREVAVVDPGDISLLNEIINSEGLTVKMILITHSHHDHVEGVRGMVEKYGVPVYMHKNARGKLEVADAQTVLVDNGEIIKLGNISIEAIWTPGHIDDALCYYIDEKHALDGVPKLLTGDTVFVEGCGRVDLLGGDVEKLYESLEMLKKLPNDTEIYPGHDYGSKPVSNLLWEKRHNPFFRCKNLEEFVRIRLPI